MKTMSKPKKTNRNSQKPKKILILEKALKFISVLILKKYNVKIIGITGSIGKTSAKEAIFTVLSGHFRVRKNEKNYNNEIGLPLTIIGCESGESSVFGWLRVFLHSMGVLLFPIEYPEILVLEMGADRPGDIKYLIDFIQCDMAVITDVSGSHLEYFKTMDRIAKEKWSLTQGLKEDALVAINIDNPIILKLKNQEKRKDLKFLTFGFLDSCDVRAAEVFYNYGNQENEKETIKGLGFKLNYKGTSIPIRLNNILARHNIYAALAGIAAGIKFDLNLVEIAETLENFSLPSGRMNLISGIKNTFIIDDTYNASPSSTEAALEVLKNIKASRKIAVLGDMFELGSDMESGHRRVARKFLKNEGDIFFAVGKRMQFSAEELRRHNFSEQRLFSFENPQEAGKKLKEIIKKGDLILVKGSQGMRMEKVVEEIMDQPQEAPKLLCRQNLRWKNTPWKKV